MPRATKKAGSNLRITAAVWLDRLDETATRAVDSQVQQSLPSDAYEILLIGDADAATEQWKTVSNLRSITDTVVDVADARNLALRISQTPLIAFLDAHAVAEPG